MLCCLSINVMSQSIVDIKRFNKKKIVLEVLNDLRTDENLIHIFEPYVMCSNERCSKKELFRSRTGIFGDTLCVFLNDTIRDHFLYKVDNRFITNHPQYTFQINSKKYVGVYHFYFFKKRSFKVLKLYYTINDRTKFICKVK